MGILNITPDSFYDGNKNFTSNAINQSLKKLLKCDIIDVGAESSRPGSKRITNTEELDRLELLFDLKIDFTKYKFSIDTYRPTTAYHCLNKGFKIVDAAKTQIDLFLSSKKKGETAFISSILK